MAVPAASPSLDSSGASPPKTDAGVPATVVWIDARSAVIVHWRDGEVTLEHLLSDVPPRHRATGHVRHGPGGHAVGAPPHAASEQHREEHLARFLEDAARHLPADDERVLVLGPHPVRERFAARLTQSVSQLHRVCAVSDEASPPLTDRQLAARARELSGVPPKRKTIRHRYRSASAPSERDRATEIEWEDEPELEPEPSVPAAEPQP